MNDLTTPKTVKLDLKNRKILYELSINPRFSYSAIAKKVRLPRETVAYRIKNLKKKNVWYGGFLIINPRAFKYRKYVLNLKLKNFSSKERKEIVAYLSQHPNVFILNECAGAWDFLISVINKSLDDLYITITEIKRELKSYIADLQISPVLEEKYTYFNFLQNDETDILKRINEKGDQSSFQTVFVESKNKHRDFYELDDVDENILMELEKDATIPISKLSYNLKISHNTAIYRIKKLIQSNVITSIIPLIDNELLDLEWHVVYFNLDFSSKKKEKEFKTYLITQPYIAFYKKVIGKYDCAITIWAKNTQHFNEILLELRNRFLDIIEQFESIIVFKQYAICKLSKIAIK